MSSNRHLSFAAIYVSLERNSWRTVGALFMFALAIRLVWLVINQPVPISDFAGYHQLATSLLEHGQLGYPNPTLDRLPGFPFFLSCLMGVSQSPVWLGAMTSVLSSALVVLVYLFTLQLTGEHGIAVLASALCAVSPTFIAFAAVLASEHVSVLLMLAALILALQFRQDESRSIGSYARVLAAGLCFGAATLTRGETVFYIPVVLLVVAATRQPRGAVAGVLLLAAIGSVTAPWYKRNTAIDDRAGLSTTSGLNFYLAHNASGYGREGEPQKVFSGLSPVERNEKGWELGWSYLRDTKFVGLLHSTAQGTFQLLAEPPVYAVKWSTATNKTKAELKWNTRLAYRAPWYGLVSAFYYSLFVFACLAWRFRQQVNRPVAVAAVSLLFMNWVCFAVVFWGKARYRYVVEVLMCAFAAVALHGIVRARRNARGLLSQERLR